MRIRARLTILFFVILAILLLITFYLIYFFAEKNQKEEFYLRLSNRANSTVDLLVRVEDVDSTILKLIDVNKKDVLENENISVYDESFKEIYTSNDSLHFYEYVENFEEYLCSVKTEGAIRMENKSTQFVFLPYSHNRKEYVVVAAAEDIQGARFLKNLRNILITTYVFILVIVVVIGWIFAGRALHPISKVIDNVNNISPENLSRRLDESKTKDEINQLIITFNDLLSRIEKAVKTQKLFVSNASHELRNPLTAITSQLEVALLNKRNNEEYEILITSVLDDIKNLNEMSKRLLQLSKIDTENGEQKFEKIRLDELLWEIKSEFNRLYPEYTVKLIIQSLPENETKLEINGVPAFIKTCLINLMENACKFSNDQSVTIEMTPTNSNITVKIINYGNGILPEDLPYIFEPFFRGKQTTGIKGYGIGLSIAYKIIQMHHAKILAESDVNKNSTTFTLYFPIA